MKASRTGGSAPATDADAGRLAPTLSLGSVVAFGVAYMSPGMVMAIFGVIAASSNGTAAGALLLATAAISLTAFSYAKMARAYPVSGSAYVYARRTLGAPVGFLVGWSVLLDYLFLPMVAWLLQSLYLNAQFPGIPVWTWLLVNAALTTAVNIVGLALSDRVNKVLTGLAFLLVLVFVAYCLVFLVDHPPASYGAPLWNAESSAAAVTAAAAVAAYSYLGFDAVTTLSEETRDAQRTIPRAVVLVVAIGGVLFTTAAFVMQLVHPGGVFEDPEIAAYTMSVQVGGERFADWLNMATIVGGFASGLAVQLSSSRLLYTMGRDGVLPKRVFGALNGRTRTPVFCVLATGAMCLLGLGLSLETATSFINFGAFTAFTVVNLCVVTHYFRNRRGHRLPVFGYVVLPAAGALATVYMLTRLSGTAVAIGACWFSVGVVYLLVLTRGFRRPTPKLSASGAAPPPDLPGPAGHGSNPASAAPAQST
ncbi:APC family permease [Yinghuangia soli]|uniref:APC family permease n=1 Tax=Yinghuangia soli TaxID=2908204 RepID=A0AA41TYS2_9ACTN|nr:APC family permease [Yinghuangia soli]MCF2528088.1 APC family permease [Yinghuangia soli]